MGRSATGRWGKVHSRLRLACISVALAAACLVGPPPLAAQDEAPDPRTAAQDALVEAAKGMARKGYGDAMRQLFDLAVEAGADEASLTKVRERAERRLELVRRPARHVRDAVAHVESAVASLASLIPATKDDEARRELIDLVLRIDSDCEPARAANTQVRSGHGWVTERVAACLDRRQEIAEKLFDVRRLDVPMETKQSNVRLLRGLYERPGTMVCWGRVSVHAVEVSEEKLRRVLRESIRAAAFARYLMTGKLALPRLNYDVKFVWLHETPLYDKAVDWSAGNGLVAAKEVEFTRGLGSFFINGQTRISKPFTEATIEAVIARDVWTAAYHAMNRDDPQPSLEAGHLHYTFSAYLGTGLPTYGWKETKEATRGTSDLDAEARKRHEMWQLAEAGLLGSRSWMRYLTERGEEPAWAQTFLPEVGMITGDLRLKATFVAQYLHERGLLDSVLKATEKKNPKSDVFEAAIGYDLATFEKEWDEWMLAPDTTVGLLQVLRGAAPEEGERELTEAELDLLAYLDEMRQSCARGAARSAVVPLSLDDELSAGCTAHAAYLSKNPEQAAAWPDAHEEWPDREGFSPEGAWAGGHGVIAPGSKDARDAIDGWMGTFYHRLPLIDPGLVRIGWGLEDGFAVLDCSSMVRPLDYVWYVAWPPSRSTAVPRTFNLELPHPVPGEDQTTWGYPITLQVDYEIDPEVTMTLSQGKAPGGPVVDCHYSTPQKPTNPELAPKGAYCLIPKAHLLPNTAYTVVVEGLEDWPDLSWSFTTGD